MKQWKVLNSEYLFKSKFLTVRKDKLKIRETVIIEDFYVLEYPDWVNVIAITEDGNFVMEKQYRHGIREIGYEICAGMIEDGETPLQAAQRELLEETGYSGGDWVQYAISSPNPSTMNNINYTFLAERVKKTANQKLDVEEDIEVELLSLGQVVELLESNLIIEGIMQAPLWKYVYSKTKK